MMENKMRTRVKQAIRRTFEVIAGDLEDACAQCGERMDLADAIEGCIDADRVRDYGGDKEAAEALYSLTCWSDMKRLGEEALREYF